MSMTVTLTMNPQIAAVTISLVVVIVLVCFSIYIRVAPAKQRGKQTFPNGDRVSKQGDPTALEAADIEILQRYYEENTEHGRHTEQERSQVTLIVITATAAIFTYMGSREFCRDFAPAASFIAIFGAFGLIMSHKQYERFNFHMSRARAFRKRLNAARPAALLDELRNAADADHMLNAGGTYNVRLHSLWNALLGAVLIVGLITAPLTAIKGKPCTAPTDAVASSQTR